MSSITQIAQRMALTIPAPSKKRAKEAQSWRTLKPGQYLSNVVRFTLRGEVVPAGSLWYVRSADSGGATLATIGDLGDDGEPRVVFKWTRPDWKGQYFVRARKPKKGKG
ncbi:MAG TPA: hypothetical protein VM366_03560 [Anaerolineae bacterium]|nr:hypothetical protein [Anaerolineae bacterium]